MPQVGLPAANAGPTNVQNTQDAALDGAFRPHSPQTEGWESRRAKWKDMAPTQEAGGCVEELPLTSLYGFRGMSRSSPGRRCDQALWERTDPGQGQ